MDGTFIRIDENVKKELRKVLIDVDLSMSEFFEMAARDYIKKTKKIRK